MKNTQDEFEKKFRDRFSGFEEEPDDRHFAAIQQQIAVPKFPFKLPVLTGITGTSFVAVLTILLVLQQDGNRQDIIRIKHNKLTTQITGIQSGKYSIQDSATNTIRQNHEKEVLSNVQSFQQTQTWKNNTTVKAKVIKEKGFNSLHSDLKTTLAFSDKKYGKADLLNLLFSKQKLAKLTSKTSSISGKPKLIPIKKSNDNKPINRFFYISLTPVMSYYHISPDKNDAVFISRINAGKVLSAERSGLKMQAGFILPLHKKIQVRAGILYSHIKQNWQYTARQGIDTLSQTYIFNKESYQIGLKTDVMYQFTSGLRLNSYAIAGFELQKELEREANSPQIKSYWHTGIGFSFRVTPEIMLFAEPDLSISFNRYTDQNRYLKVRPYHVGINAGVVFRLQP